MMRIALMVVSIVLGAILGFIVTNVAFDRTYLSDPRPVVIEDGWRGRRELRRGMQQAIDLSEMRWSWVCWGVPLGAGLGTIAGVLMTMLLRGQGKPVSPAATN